jgi:hypothetical protein
MISIVSPLGNFMSEQPTDRYTNSPLQKKEIHRSPAIKRITTLKGMGKF